jgi:hypothetical protein
MWALIRIIVGDGICQEEIFSVCAIVLPLETPSETGF